MFATARQCLIMRDENKRCAFSRMKREHEFDDLRPCRLIEIAGRLVGKQDFGIAHDRAGQRHALLLAT